MNFTEPIFLPFILAVLIGLSLVRSKQQAIILIIVSSALFYGWWNISFLLLLAGAAIVDFFLGRWIGACSNTIGRRLLLGTSIIWNLGLLFYFKYINFAIDSINRLSSTLHLKLPHLDLHSIVLPVGISFFVFETLSYSVDVYRGHFKPITRLSHFLLFISFFPHLVAGPIVRGKDFLPQVEADFLSKRDWTGIFLIVFGLAKKVLIADQLGNLAVDRAFANPAQYGSLDLVFAVYCYAFQIFLDFSGYTDIAIGLARIMGFDLGINFNAPYIARSFSEFWRRWHISLSTWFRDYVFIPLGGSRVGTGRMCVNLVIVFLASGLWHGADSRFIIWGALNGLFLVGETILTFRPPIAKRKSDEATWSTGGIFKALLVFNSICFTWIFFRAESWTKANEMLGLIFTFKKTSISLATGLPFYLLMVAIALHISVERMKDRAASFFLNLPTFVSAGIIAIICGLLLNISLQRIGHKAFIYFQF